MALDPNQTAIDASDTPEAQAKLQHKVQVMNYLEVLFPYSVLAFDPVAFGLISGLSAG